MKKIILTLILTLGSANLYAGVQCDTTNIDFKEKYENKLLKTEISGTCSITAEGDLSKLKAYFVGDMTDAPKIREVHNVNETATFDSLPATEIDSTSFDSNSNGDLEVRFLTHVGENGERLFSHKESKKMVSATGNSKRLKKISEVINVTKTDGGFKVEIMSGTHVKVPKMFRGMAIKEIKKGFPDMLKSISKEIAENL
jgi:hypothetical protein